MNAMHLQLSPSQLKQQSEYMNKKTPTPTPQRVDDTLPNDILKNLKKIFEMLPDEQAFIEEEAKNGGYEKIEAYDALIDLLATAKVEGVKEGKIFEQEQLLKILKKVECIAVDEKKSHWCDHCSCLRYAIDLIERPDTDRVFEPSHPDASQEGEQ